MPTGMTLSSSGVLSGTPTLTGIFSLQVSVTDSAAITPVSATYTDHRHCPHGNGDHERACAGRAVRGVPLHYAHGQWRKSALHVVRHRAAGGNEPERRRSPDRHAHNRRFLLAGLYRDG